MIAGASPAARTRAAATTRTTWTTARTTATSTGTTSAIGSSSHQRSQAAGWAGSNVEGIEAAAKHQNHLESLDLVKDTRISSKICRRGSKGTAATIQNGVCY